MSIVSTIATPQRWYWAASLLPIVAGCFYVLELIVNFRKLPSQVPVHFGFQGDANGWMNRSLWLVVSPLVLAAILALVFVTLPMRAPGDATIPTVIYWCACGLVLGAFHEIVRSAARQKRFSLVPLLAGLLLMPILEGVLVLWLVPWWTA